MARKDAPKFELELPQDMGVSYACATFAVLALERRTEAMRRMLDRAGDLRLKEWSEKHAAAMIGMTTEEMDQLAGKLALIRQYEEMQALVVESVRGKDNITVSGLVAGGELVVDNITQKLRYGGKGEKFRGIFWEGENNKFSLASWTIKTEKRYTHISFSNGRLIVSGDGVFTTYLQDKKTGEYKLVASEWRNSVGNMIAGVQWNGENNSYWGFSISGESEIKNDESTGRIEIHGLDLSVTFPACVVEEKDEATLLSTSKMAVIMEVAEKALPRITENVEK